MGVQFSRKCDITRVAEGWEEGKTNMSDALLPSAPRTTEDTIPWHFVTHRRGSPPQIDDTHLVLCAVGALG